MSTLKTTALILIMVLLVLSAGTGHAGVLPQNPEKAKAEKPQQIAKKRGAMIQIGSMPSSKESEFKKGAAITIGSYPLTEG